MIFFRSKMLEYENEVTNKLIKLEKKNSREKGIFFKEMFA